MTDSLVPEGFDLKAARHAKSTTPEEQFDRCPECGSIKVHSKGKRNRCDRQYETDYSCSNCGAHFDDPLGEADA